MKLMKYSMWLDDLYYCGWEKVKFAILSTDDYTKMAAVDFA